MGKVSVLVGVEEWSSGSRLSTKSCKENPKSGQENPKFGREVEHFTTTFQYTEVPYIA